MSALEPSTPRKPLLPDLSVEVAYQQGRRLYVSTRRTGLYDQLAALGAHYVGQGWSWIGSGRREQVLDLLAPVLERARAREQVAASGWTIKIRRGDEQMRAAVKAAGGVWLPETQQWSVPTEQARDALAAAATQAAAREVRIEHFDQVQTQLAAGLGGVQIEGGVWRMPSREAMQELAEATKAAREAAQAQAAQRAEREAAAALEDARTKAREAGREPIGDALVVNRVSTAGQVGQLVWGTEDRLLFTVGVFDERVSEAAALEAEDAFGDIRGPGSYRWVRRIEVAATPQELAARQETRQVLAALDDLPHPPEQDAPALPHGGVEIEVQERFTWGDWRTTARAGRLDGRWVVQRWNALSADDDRFPEWQGQSVQDDQVAEVLDGVVSHVGAHVVDQRRVVVHDLVAERAARDAAAEAVAAAGAARVALASKVAEQAGRVPAHTPARVVDIDGSEGVPPVDDPDVGEVLTVDGDRYVVVEITRDPYRSVWASPLAPTEQEAAEAAEEQTQAQARTEHQQRVTQGLAAQVTPRQVTLVLTDQPSASSAAGRNVVAIQAGPVRETATPKGRTVTVERELVEVHLQSAVRTSRRDRRPKKAEDTVVVVATGDTGDVATVSCGAVAARIIGARHL